MACRVERACFTGDSAIWASSAVYCCSSCCRRAFMMVPSCEIGGPGMTPIPPFCASDVNVDARVDRKIVLHFGDAGGIAGGALGIPQLRVRAHGAAQDRLVALDLDTDPL